MDELSPLEKLDAYVRRHVEYNTRNLTKIAVYYHDYKLLAPERRAESAASARCTRTSSRVWSARRSAGARWRTTWTRRRSNCLFGALNSVYTWYRPGGKVTTTQLADTLARFVLAGIRTS